MKINYKNRYKKGTYDHAWCGFLTRCKERKEVVDLTFEEFVTWWESTGLFDQRGVHSDQYCMSRINKADSFNLNNIECITNRQHRKNQFI